MWWNININSKMTCLIGNLRRLQPQNYHNLTISNRKSGELVIQNCHWNLKVFPCYFFCRKRPVYRACLPAKGEPSSCWLFELFSLSGYIVFVKAITREHDISKWRGRLQCWEPNGAVLLSNQKNWHTSGWHKRSAGKSGHVISLVWLQRRHWG